MQFGLEVIHLVESLPRGRTADMIAGQLLRAGTAAVRGTPHQAIHARQQAQPALLRGERSL